MFDKILYYWKRRNNTVTTGKGKNKVVTRKPLRGQGEPFNPVGGPAKVGGKPVSTKALRKNTKRARKEALKDGSNRKSVKAEATR